MPDRLRPLRTQPQLPRRAWARRSDSRRARACRRRTRAARSLRLLGVWLEVALRPALPGALRIFEGVVRQASKLGKSPAQRALGRVSQRLADVNHERQQSVLGELDRVEDLDEAVISANGAKGTRGHTRSVAQREHATKAGPGRVITPPR